MTHVSKAYHIVTFLIRIVMVTPCHYAASYRDTFTASEQKNMKNFLNLMSAGLLLTTLLY